jgi:hypothetical protein
MKESSVRRTPGDGSDARRGARGSASVPGDLLDGAPLTVNDLMQARYRHHLATGFTPDLAVLLAEWDVAGYLRVTAATRTDDHHRP